MCVCERVEKHLNSDKTQKQLCSFVNFGIIAQKQIHMRYFGFIRLRILVFSNLNTPKRTITEKSEEEKKKKKKKKNKKRTRTRTNKNNNKKQEDQDAQEDQEEEQEQ